MSDISTAPEGAAAPATPAAPGLDGSATALDALEQRPDLPAETLAEVKKLRQEHKNYRERYAPYEKAFGQWSQSDRDAILGLAQLIDSNPAEAARWMHENAKTLAGEKWAEIVGAAQKAAQTPISQQPDPNAAAPGNLGQTPSAPETQGFLTRDEFEAELTRRERERSSRDQLERDKQAIIDKSDELGFGPSHWAHASLLSIARQNGGDLDAAAEALRQNMAGMSQEQLASKEAEASRTPAPANGATPAGQETGTPEQRMKARLDEAFGKAQMPPA